jgi:putative membrane protein
MLLQGLITRWLILTAAITIASYLMEGIWVSGFLSALFTAAVLGILNAFFRPILLILTLPINVLTLGLFTFVINAFLLKVASGVISGFEVHGFWSAVFGALVISLINWLLSSFLTGQGPQVRVERKRPGHERGDRGSYIDLERKDDDHWE